MTHEPLRSHSAFDDARDSLLYASFSPRPAPHELSLRFAIPVHLHIYRIEEDFHVPVSNMLDAKKNRGACARPGAVVSEIRR